eukprot:gene44313-54186_t
MPPCRAQNNTGCHARFTALRNKSPFATNQLRCGVLCCSMKATSRNNGRQGRLQQPYQAAASRRVYVGNLDYTVTWQELKDHMKLFGGHVLHADVLTFPDGRSKGCGIVEFSTVHEAQTAIERLNDSELKGRKVFMREDREDPAGAPAQRHQAPPPA